MMKDHGVSGEVAQQVLGHASAAVNVAFYTGTLSRQQRQAVAALPSIG